MRFAIISETCLYSGARPKWVYFDDLASFKVGDSGIRLASPSPVDVASMRGASLR